MRRKIIITLSILAVLGIGVAVYKKYTKKPCGCGAAGNAQAAINGMTEQELIDQIKKINPDLKTDGKTLDELKALLLDLTK